MAASDKFIFGENQPWTPMAPGLKRQIKGYDDNIMVVRVMFEYKGAIAAPHSHPHAQSSMIASGKFIFKVGDEAHEVVAGDGIYMEPNVIHSCECIEPGVVVDTFSPMREDFL